MMLAEARTSTIAEMGRLFERCRRTGYGPLYDLVADYPFRDCKALRPAILISACRASGGTLDQALTSATALELFHNGFLLFDDIHDQSDQRRGRATMFQSHGVPATLNAGNATNILALGLLLDNVGIVGVRKSLLVLRDIERMARESAEGQAIELTWIHKGQFELSDEDYARMAYKKTCWYTVIAPLRIGVICGSAPGSGAPLDDELLKLIELGFFAGVAFQICDDLLNLEADEQEYGKETSGDLWEGKRTVMLLHFMRTADAAVRERARTILLTPRATKTAADVQWLLEQMKRNGSLDHGHRLAIEYSERAIAVDATLTCFRESDGDRRFLREMLRFVIGRTK